MTKPGFLRGGTCLFLAALAILVILRFLNLENDPPLVFTQYGQSQVTDPYYYTMFARNQVLYGTWDLFPNDVWDVVKYSLVSGWSYLVFVIGGVSKVSANVGSLLLSLAGIFFFLAGLSKHRHATEVGATAAVLLAHGILFVYGRMPYMENGLLFFSGVIFWLFSRYGERRLSLPLLGLLVAAATCHAKPFGLVMAAPVLVCTLCLHRDHWLRSAAFFGAGLGAGFAAYVLIFHGGDLGAILRYNSEIQVMYSRLPYFRSPADFAIGLASYGMKSGLTELSLPLLTLAGVGILLAVSTTDLWRPCRENLPLLFCLVWLVAGTITLVPFGYRPLRYWLFCYLPVGAFAGLFVSAWNKPQIPLAVINWRVSVPVFLGIFFYLPAQFLIFGHLIIDAKDFPSRDFVIIIAAAAATIVTAVSLFVLKRWSVILTRKHLIPVLTVLVFWYGAWEARLIYQTLIGPGQMLSRAGSEVTALIDPTAVVTGPHGPTLTINNQLRGVYNYFGVSRSYRELYQTYPVTHVFGDSIYVTRLVSQLPQLRHLRKIAEFIVRQTRIGVYRLPGATVPPTSYEQFVELVGRGQMDSATIRLEQFLADHPQNRPAQLAMIHVLMGRGRIDQALAQAEEMARAYPRDYFIMDNLSNIYLKAYELTGKAEHYRSYERYYERAVELTSY